MYSMHKIKFSKDMITSAMVTTAGLVIKTKALVETVSPIVTAYQREVLKRFQFTNEEFLARTKKVDVTPTVILDPKDSYKLSEEDFDIYLEACRVEQQKAQLKTDTPEQCPKLVAERLYREARRAFNDEMKAITGIGTDDILRGANGFANLDKLTDLNLKLIASVGLLKVS